MEQNQTIDNDLQKAIDDITKTTSIDPVFSDPVAAPSSVPEGDTGELGEPNGPFPDEPVVEAPAFIPTPVPDLPPAPVPGADIPTPPETPIVLDTNISAPSEEIHDDEISESPNNIHEIKEAALRDLIPLLDHLNMDALQKFNLYRNIFENLRDYTVLEPAYRAAKEIADEAKRAEALLYLVQSIDKM